MAVLGVIIKTLVHDILSSLNNKVLLSKYLDPFKISIYYLLKRELSSTPVQLILHSISILGIFQSKKYSQMFAVYIEDVFILSFIHIIYFSGNYLGFTCTYWKSLNF